MKNIVLIGMMGCGKTSCARLLSRRLRRPAVDTDRLVVERAGMEISDIFAQKGEEWFRNLETEVVRALGQAGGYVIATGGGLPLRAENRALIRENGVVFFLDRPPERIFDSVNLSDRPLAQNGRADFIRRFQAREPVYRAAAHFTVANTGALQQTVEEIIRLWNRENGI